MHSTQLTDIRARFAREEETEKEEEEEKWKNKLNTAMLFIIIVEWILLSKFFASGR